MKGRVFVVGASLSGIDALCELVAKLPGDFPAAIFITQHVASHSPGMLPKILRNAGRLPASHPKNGQLIEAGQIYVAPPDRHLLIQQGYVRLSHGPHENHARPAVDALFRSAAVAYGSAAVGVVLTGQLDDGTAGLLAIKDRGGVTIVQDPSEATMPLSAIRHVKIDYLCNLAEMVSLLVVLAHDDAPSEAEHDISVTERGAALAERMCSKCHAIGRGGASLHARTPAFRELGGRSDLDFFADLLRENLSVCHQHADLSLSREDAQALVRYLRCIQAQ
jgi:hypothetical protein